MQPQYENMHTREQSVTSFCSHFDASSSSHCHSPTHTRIHTTYCSCQKTHETTSVSALIYTMNTRGRRIYTQLRMALYSTNNITSHENTVEVIVCANFSFSCWIISWMIWIQFDMFSFIEVCIAPMSVFSVLRSVKGVLAPLWKPKSERQWEA